MSAQGSAWRLSAGTRRSYQNRWRATHAGAISNERLISLADGVVTFAVLNNNDGGRRKKLQHLPASLFIQRSMSHVLPQEQKRIRHYGLLANCHKREKLALCRLTQFAPEPVTPLIETIDAFMQRVAQIDIAVCNECGNGHFKVIAAIAPFAPFCPYWPAAQPRQTGTQP